MSCQAISTCCQSLSWRCASESTFINGVTASNDTMDKIERIFSEKIPNFKEALRTAHPLIADSIRPKVSGEELDEEEKLSAILAISLKFIKKIPGNFEESYARLETACAISKVDLAQKWMNRDLMSKGEYQELEGVVESVREFGSVAADLWGQLRQQKVLSVDQLKVKDTTQREILAEAIKLPEWKEGSELKSFGAEVLKIKEIFLRATATIPKKALVHFSSGQWVTDPQQSDTLEELLEEIEIDEQKSENPDSERFLFQSDLEILGNEKVSPERNRFLAHLRLDLINHILKIPQGFLSQAQKELISEKIVVLKRLDSVMCQIFYTLKQTMDPKILKEKYLLSESTLASVKSSIDSEEQFLPELKKSTELGELSIQSLAVIYQAALLVSETDWKNVRNQFSLLDWISETKSKKYKLTPSQKSRSFIAPSPNLKVARLERLEDPYKLMANQRKHSLSPVPTGSGASTPVLLSTQQRNRRLNYDTALGLDD